MKAVHRCIQCCRFAFIVDDIVGRCQALISTCLCTEDGLRLGFVTAIAPHESADLNRFGDIHDQYPVDQSMLASFHQKRNHEDDIGALSGLQGLLHGPADGGMHDAVERAALLGLGEDMFAESLPVQSAVRGEHVGAKGLDQLIERGLAGFDDIAGQGIGIDHRDTKARESFRNG